jgi:hypothetical protein
MFPLLSIVVVVISTPCTDSIIVTICNHVVRLVIRIVAEDLTNQVLFHVFTLSLCTTFVNRQFLDQIGKELHCVFKIAKRNGKISRIYGNNPLILSIIEHQRDD